MRVGRILAISVVGLASIIVLAAAIVTINFLVSSREAGANKTSFPPKANKPFLRWEMWLCSRTRAGTHHSSYLKSPSNGANQRLTAASNGIESEPSFSHDGKLVVYSFANSPDSKSEVWAVRAEGRNPHPITGKDQDTLIRFFLLMAQECSMQRRTLRGTTLQSSAPARHDWDVYSIPVQPNAMIAAL